MNPNEAGILQRMVLCTCGHALDHHSSAGCRGDRRQICACQYDPTNALDAAVDHARTEPWRPWGEPETPTA
jgi:hypothetical protein